LKITVLLLAAVLSACISVRERETKTVDAQKAARRLDGAYSDQRVGTLQVRAFVYKPGEIPLGDFLKKLAHGDYRTALKAAHLRYAPSNINDDAVRTMVREGFVPVLVEVENAGTGPADLKRLALTLDDDGRTLEPLPNDALPRVFEAINPKALAANVYNTGAVVVGSVAVAVTFAATVWAHLNDGRGAFEMPYALGNMLDAFDGDLYNAASKTTIVDYAGLLWSAPTLAPGAKARGLLFFRAPAPDWAALRLKAALPAP